VRRGGYPVAAAHGTPSAARTYGSGRPRSKIVLTPEGMASEKKQWEINRRSLHCAALTCLGQAKDGMNAAFRLYPVDRSKGAPYLARFWRDVGYRNCLLTHAPRKTEVPWRFCSLGSERTRISYYALLATTTCAPLCRESHTEFINATGLNRKSGGAQWRDLRFISRTKPARFHPTVGRQSQ
jgi:hypothetical protein